MDGSYADSSVVQNLRDAVGTRLKQLGLTMGNLANGIGRDESTLRAWMRGANRVAFEDVLALDSYFADLGQDGLLEELRPYPQRGYWRAEEEPLAAIGGDEEQRLLQRLLALPNAPHAPLSMLAGAELLDKCLLYFRLDGSVYPIHKGSQCPPPFSELDTGLDLRRHSDSGLGNLLHRCLLAQLQDGDKQPRLLRLISPHSSCRQVSLLLNESFLVSLPLPTGAA